MNVVPYHRHGLQFELVNAHYVSKFDDLLGFSPQACLEARCGEYTLI